MKEEKQEEKRQQEERQIDDIRKIYKMIKRRKWRDCDFLVRRIREYPIIQSLLEIISEDSYSESENLKFVLQLFFD